MKANSSIPTAKLLIADDIRLEVNGKASLLGFFPDNVIVSDAAGREVTPAEPVVLSIAFMISLSNFPSKPKKYRSVLELIKTSGEAEKISEQPVANPGPGLSTNLVFKFMGLGFPDSGVRHIRLRLDDAIIDLPYEVRIINANAASQVPAAKTGESASIRSSDQSKSASPKKAVKKTAKKSALKKPA